MKMEHAIRAPRDGTVARVLFAEGDLVDAGAVLAEITDGAVPPLSSR
jgi:Acetyl/propionyl-CoA carboxylase, alpha subunit